MRKRKRRRRRFRLRRRRKRARSRRRKTRKRKRTRLRRRKKRRRSRRRRTKKRKRRFRRRRRSKRRSRRRKRRSVKRKRKRPKRRKSSKRSERAISIGIELETYTISIPDYRISRELHYPRRGIAELGEKFKRDLSIGNEYNSRVFFTIREAFFLLKNGLRKYIHYRPSSASRERVTLFPIGGWTDRFAGMHIHVALGKKKFDYARSRSLARKLHDHIPFIIALTGNSPVWRERINQINSNRLLLGTKKYCQLTRREAFSKLRYRELTFNAGGMRKPPTLELRVPDSGVPEYIAAAACVVKAVALAWLKRRPVMNQLSYQDYLLARDRAVHYGPQARLFWNHHAVTVSQYVDLFFRKYEDELKQMEIPSEVVDIFKYLKKEWNQATVIRRAAQKSRWLHRPTWERRFAKRYATAIERLLDGNSYSDFARTLGIRLPHIKRVWLGRKEAKW